LPGQIVGCRNTMNHNMPLRLGVVLNDRGRGSL
jgi:hypothetical protein